MKRQTKTRISSRDISVVVRGLVVGAKKGDNTRRYTERCILAIRSLLPEAEIILSTWNEEVFDDLDYDVLVTNPQPTPVMMIHAGHPPKLIAANNQIISAAAGLTRASRKYTLDIRSDLELSSTRFINYFLRFNERGGGEHFKMKMVVLPTYDPRRGTKILFNVCDWMHFGLTEDLRNLFDIPLMRDEDLRGARIDGYAQIKNNFESEAYIWTSFLRKYETLDVPNQSFYSEKLRERSERSYAKDTIMVPAHVLGVSCLKMPHAGYGARPWLSQGLYTFDDYKCLYNRYNQDKILRIPNLAEKILYATISSMREFTKRYAPRLHRRIVNIVRRAHDSYNLLK